MNATRIAFASGVSTSTGKARFRPIRTVRTAGFVLRLEKYMLLRPWVTGVDSATPQAMTEQERTFRILLIEDNPADAELLRIAFAESAVARTELSVLADSTKLIHFLHGQGPFTGAPLPDLILLDYHHPLNGGVALAQVNGSPDIVHIPVVVITGSDDPDVIDEAYSRHANCVLRKPADLDGLMQMARDIEAYWFKKVRLPRRRQPAQPSYANL